MYKNIRRLMMLSASFCCFFSVSFAADPPMLGRTLPSKPPAPHQRTRWPMMPWGRRKIEPARPHKPAVERPGLSAERLHNKIDSILRMLISRKHATSKMSNFTKIIDELKTLYLRWIKAPTVSQKLPIRREIDKYQKQLKRRVGFKYDPFWFLMGHLDALYKEWGKLSNKSPVYVSEVNIREEIRLLWTELAKTKSAAHRKKTWNGEANKLKKTLYPALGKATSRSGIDAAKKKLIESWENLSHLASKKGGKRRRFGALTPYQQSLYGDLKKLTGRMDYKSE